MMLGDRDKTTEDLAGLMSCARLTSNILLPVPTCADFSSNPKSHTGMVEITVSEAVLSCVFVALKVKLVLSLSVWGSTSQVYCCMSLALMVWPVNSGLVTVPAPKMDFTLNV